MGGSTRIEGGHTNTTAHPDGQRSVTHHHECFRSVLMVDKMYRLMWHSDGGAKPNDTLRQQSQVGEGQL